MNLLDAYVERAVSKPYIKYGKWCVDVEYYCWSDQPSYTTLFFSTKERALACQKGHHFLC